MSKILPTDGHDELAQLSVIAPLAGVSISQLNEWGRRATNDFPEPVVTLGKYKLYNKEQVIAWVSLWLKINKNMGNPGLRNGNRNG